MVVKVENKYEKFFGKEWAQWLGPFLSSNEYKKIGAEIMRQKNQGIDITPGLENMFRAYKECPWHSLHTVILGQDVYPGKNKDGTYIADGIAFSARENSDPPPSLNSILEAIDNSVYTPEDNWTPCSVFNQERMEATWDLQAWAKQGILMINCAYTTVVSRPNEHINIWKPFTENVIELINNVKDSVGWVFMGTHAREYAKTITNSTHMVFQCEHPAAALYKGRKWEHNNVFKDLTYFQKTKNNITINW